METPACAEDTYKGKHGVILVEILDVSPYERDPTRLWGYYIDLPEPNTQTEACALELVGWVVGRSSPAVAVEVVYEDTVLRRVPLNVRRPDVAAAFPEVSGAEDSGFSTVATALGTTPEFELSVRAVLRDKSRVPLVAIRGRWRWQEEDRGVGAALVSVVIPCYNQARFLGEAIESVLAQTYPHFEVVVVDDGSKDNTGEVAGRYPGVRLVCQEENQGLAAARNAGLRRSGGGYVVFLDADDRLLPEALEAGLKHLNAHPGCALVCGRCEGVGEDGSPPLPTPQRPATGGGDPYLELLGGNHVARTAAVMFRRAVLEAVVGFDASASPAEDYELYLRIARDYPIRCHEKVVAQYRRHRATMTRDAELMLRSSLGVLRAQRKHLRRRKRSERYEQAYEAGVERWREEYGEQLAQEVRERAREGEWRRALGGLAVLLRHHPPWRRRSRPPVGRVRFGDLRRMTPVGRNFGFERGQPIDRYYVEDFLSRHAEDIRGRVLEIQDASYTLRYGGDRVTASDVLNLEEGSPNTTIVGDLSRAGHIPSEAFDCVILTQTLHLIYDVRAALETLYRILKPGGVLLATVPGISPIEWINEWYWSFTVRSARRLFEEAFAEENVEVETHGNSLAATAFLQGLAAEELREEELDYRDPDYEVLLAIRAAK